MKQRILADLFAVDRPEAVLEEVCAFLQLDSIPFDAALVRRLYRACLSLYQGNWPGYRDGRLTVAFEGVEYEALVYLAEPDYVDPALRPYRWYRDLVWQGAVYNAAPAEYRACIAEMPAVTDPDPERRARHQELLARIRSGNSSAGIGRA